MHNGYEPQVNMKMVNMFYQSHMHATQNQTRAQITAMSMLFLKSSYSSSWRGRYRVGSQVEAVGRHHNASEENLMVGVFGNPNGGMWYAPVAKLKISPKSTLICMSSSSSRGISQPPTHKTKRQYIVLQKSVYCLPTTYRYIYMSCFIVNWKESSPLQNSEFKIGDIQIHMSH